MTNRYLEDLLERAFVGLFLAVIVVMIGVIVFSPLIVTYRFTGNLDVALQWELIIVGIPTALITIGTVMKETRR